VEEEPDAVLEDWAQLISFRPDVVLRPTSIAELEDLVERVHRGEPAHGRVRVPGSLHSCSRIVVSDALLDTSRLAKTIDFECGDAAVVASANVSLHEFLAALGARGKSVTATGGTDHQTLTGLISTGTAPASSRHALYELLDWVELVTVDPATGRAVQRRIARGDPEFSAVVCSLGLLGVITRVRFRLVDELHSPSCRRSSTWTTCWPTSTPPRPSTTSGASTGCPSEKALLWAARAVPSGASTPDVDYPADQAEHVLDVVFRALDKLTDTGPLLTDVLDLVYNVLAVTYKDLHVTGPLRNMLPVDRRAPLHVAMAEWSFRPQDPARVLGACEEYFERAGWPNIPTEIELTRVDGSLMSPWHWDGLEHIVKFNFIYLTEPSTGPGEKDTIYAHLRGLWQHLRAAGIPFKAHWGKINFIEPDFVRANHQLDAFRPLASPIFLNDHLLARIGPL